MPHTPMKTAWAAAAALSLAVAAAPAAAGVSITMQTRPWDTLSATTSADYVAAWNAALAANPTPPTGYGDYAIADWNGAQSNCLFGGSCSNVAYRDRVVFTVDPSQAGAWDFRFGIDFGLGGTVLLDGVELDTRSSDMWWAGGFGDGSQFLAGSGVLAAGSHVLDVYGFEGCCDGGTSGQFRAPDMGEFATFAASVGGAVPEPAMWALMIVGVGATGAALRHRRARVLAGA